MDTKHLFVGKKLLTAVFVFLFGIFGIQSSYADYYPSGPQQNVSEQTLRNNGWTLFYEQTYGTTIDSITQIRPSGQYVILSGKAVGSSNILLAAAAPTSQVFTETVRNTPQLLNGAYWYLTLGIGSWGNPEVGSIGFAPTSDITQDQADTNSGEQRLSWHVLSNHAGGYRIGDTISLNSSTAYLKQVWTWNGVSTTNVRQTNNLSFAQSLHGSDTLSDEDGQLRATVDQIMNKYGSLIK
jgi:hypothetical protein